MLFQPYIHLVMSMKAKSTITVELAYFTIKSIPIICTSSHSPFPYVNLPSHSTSTKSHLK